MVVPPPGGAAIRVCLIPLACLLAASVVADDKPPAGIAADVAKTVTVDAKVAPRKVLEEVYPIELIACWPYKKEPQSCEAVKRVIEIAEKK